MGIPAFYRWLTTRYKKTVVPAVEEWPSTVNGVAVPVRTSDPNPNGVEYDNLYLDMNGIVHPCFHPENLPTPSSYEEVFEAVFKYIDKIFSIVRPRKLLYMAIDGVAPRAKMNQQRSRRFRAAKDAAEAALNLGLSGRHLLEPEEEREDKRRPERLDSNVITPGTEFMDLLSQALHYYIQLRMNNDPGWQGIKVILSDATVPGEGEHKIMSYIRLQRNLPGYDPNTRHCLYGLDADLIMLALATHEVHFTILREDVQKASQETNKSTRKMEMKLDKRKHSRASLETEKTCDMLEKHISGLEFQLLNIWVLREYLADDMRAPDSAVETELERLIDDFVFICLFVGNDFLPHIPSLEIYEGAIDLLMAVYKKEFIQMGGYLTNSFEINFSRLEHFIQAVGSHESAIFRKRLHMQKEQEAQIKAFSKRQHILKLSKLPPGDGAILPENHELSEPSRAETINLKKDEEDVNSDADVVRLGEEGWRERYYADKFDAKHDDERERVQRHAVMKYMEGIAWVMRYYYEGVCSWQWFYPYHYAPFASDFCGLSQLEIRFSLGKPFKPFDQLMAVLPAASAHALPSIYRKLMTDPSSPLLDFYPSDVEIDMNGKRFSWQAICKLPFIEESRLLSEIAKVEHTLTDDERRRNSWGLDTLFIHIGHPLAITIVAFFGKHDHVQSPGAEVSIKIDPETSGGMNGFIKMTNDALQTPLISSPIDGMEMIAENKVLSVLYELPHFHPHIPMLLEGVILPNKSVRKQEMPSQHSLWHETKNHHRVSSRRPIKNAISGSRLAKCARLLISKVFPPKQQDQRGCSRLTMDASGRLGMVEVKTKTSERFSETKSPKSRSKGGKDHEDAMPDKGFDAGELNGRCSNPPNGYALNGMVTEKKSETSKKKRRKRKRNKDSCLVNAGVVEANEEVGFKLSSQLDTTITINIGKSNGNNDLQISRSCVLKDHEDAMPNQDFDAGELDGRCGNPPIGYALNGMVTEKKSETSKKKRRKRKQNKDSGLVNASVIEANEEVGSELSSQTDTTITINIGKSNGNNDLQISRSCVLKDHEDAMPNKDFDAGELYGRCGNPPNGYALNGLVTEKNSETCKKKRRKRKRNKDSGLVNASVIEANEVGSELSSQTDTTITTIIGKSNGKNDLQTSRSCILKDCKPASGNDVCTVSDQPVEAKIEVKTKRRNRKKKRAEDNNNLQRLKDCVVEEQKAAADYGAAIQSDQAGETKIEMKTRKKGESKKRRRADDGSSVHRLKSGVVEERDASADFDGCMLSNQAVEAKMEVETSVKLGRKKRSRFEDTDKMQNLESSVLGEEKATADYGLHAPLDQAVEVKIDEKSRKEQNRKKMERTKERNIAHSGVQNLETCAAGEYKQPVIGQAALGELECLNRAICVEKKAGYDFHVVPIHNMESKTEGKISKKRRVKEARKDIVNPAVL